VRIDEPGFSTAPVGTPRPSGPVNGPADIGGLAAETMLVWWDGPADAFLNMAADEALAAESLRHGGPVVRFYGWEPTSVSLGAFQRLADARQVAAIAMPFTSLWWLNSSAADSRPGGTRRDQRPRPPRMASGSSASTAGRSATS